jgi:hypothetical protein
MLCFARRSLLRFSIANAPLTRGGKRQTVNVALKELCEGNDKMILLTLTRL